MTDTTDKKDFDLQDLVANRWSMRRAWRRLKWHALRPSRPGSEQPPPVEEGFERYATLVCLDRERPQSSLFYRIVGDILLHKATGNLVIKMEPEYVEPYGELPRPTGDVERIRKTDQCFVVLAPGFRTPKPRSPRRPSSG